MQRLKRSYVFWTLLLVAVILPASLSATGKRLYWAPIADDAGSGKGSATILYQPSGLSFMAATYALPGSVVTQVWLEPRDGSWQIPLCTNGGPPEDDCTYKPDGNLDLDGPLTASMLIAAGVSGSTFLSTLTAGDLGIRISYDGMEAGGFFIRII